MKDEELLMELRTFGDVRLPQEMCKRTLLQAIPLEGKA